MKDPKFRPPTLYAFVDSWIDEAGIEKTAYRLQPGFRSSVLDAYPEQSTKSLEEYKRLLEKAKAEKAILVYNKLPVLFRRRNVSRTPLAHILELNHLINL